MSPSVSKQVSLSIFKVEFPLVIYALYLTYLHVPYLGRIV